MKVFFLCLLATLFSAADAQLLKGALKKVSEKMERNPVQDILQKPPSISTSLDNVKMEGALEPSFGNDSTYKELTALPRTANGGFTLKTGFTSFMIKVIA